MSVPNKGLDEHGRPPLPAGRWCNARTHQSKGYCERPAGWGTLHLGSGRCKLHGGSTPTQNKPVIVDPEAPQGIAAPKNLREAAERRKHDPELHSLEGEIATLRAVQERIMITISEDDTINPEDPAITALLGLSNRIGKLIADHHRIQMDKKMLVPAHRVVTFIETVGKAIREHINDPEIIEAIYRELEAGEKIN